MSISFDNEVSVVIDGLRFRFWSQISITRSIDNMDTIDLQGPFDPSDPNQRETFRPLTYKPIQVLVNDAPLFSGVMADVTSRVAANKTEFAVGAYSNPAELSAIMVPGDDPNPPREFRKQNLHEIATTLAATIDVAIDPRVPSGGVFKKVRIEPEQPILSFLVDLAKQRNQVISSSPVGAMVFWRAVTGENPVAFLEQGQSPVIGCQPSLNSDQYYSQITGMKPTRVRSKTSAKFTVQNPYLVNVLRPYTYTVDDVDAGSLQTAVQSKITRMYANAIGYTLEVATWCDASGRLWEPNTVVKVLYPGAMIYRPYDFIIRTVTFTRDGDSETASLDVMIPGSFSEEGVGGLPWDE